MAQFSEIIWQSKGDKLLNKITKPKINYSSIYLPSEIVKIHDRLSVIITKKEILKRILVKIENFDISCKKNIESITKFCKNYLKHIKFLDTNYLRHPEKILRINFRLNDEEYKIIEKINKKLQNYINPSKKYRAMSYFLIEVLEETIKEPDAITFFEYLHDEIKKNTNKICKEV